MKEIDKLLERKNIEILKCLECKNPLLLETRYKEKINIVLKHINKIKKICYDKNNGFTDDTFYIKTKDIIVNNIITQFKIGNIYIFDILSRDKIYYEQK